MNFRGKNNILIFFFKKKRITKINEAFAVRRNCGKTRLLIIFGLSNSSSPFYDKDPIKKKISSYLCRKILERLDHDLKQLFHFPLFRDIPLVVILSPVHLSPYLAIRY